MMVLVSIKGTEESRTEHQIRGMNNLLQSNRTSNPRNEQLAPGQQPYHLKWPSSLQRRPHQSSNQSMAILDLASWAVFGAAVQGLAQGIRQKPLNYKPIGYVYSATLFVAVGLALDQVRARQRSFLDRRVAVLAQERAARGVDFARQE